MLNGLSIFIQFLSFGVMFYTGIIYIETYNIPIEGVLEAIFLIVFAGFSIVNSSNYMPDLSSAKQAVNKIFTVMELEDEYQLR